MADTIRIASYNIEWFTELFGDQDVLDLSDAESKRYNTTKKEQGEALAKVFQETNADLYCIIEAPNTTSDNKRSTVRALENFANHFNLRVNKALIGYVSTTEQEIALLYDPDKVSATHSPMGTKLIDQDNTLNEDVNPSSFLKGYQLKPSPVFNSFFILDVEFDGVREVHQFSRPPLEATIDIKSDGDVVLSFQLIGVHTKSKGVFEPFDEIQSVNRSLANRRKLLAQCQWIRFRIEEILKEGKHLIILGDFNDGPGLDFYERQFGRSGVEIVMGDVGLPETLLRCPFSRTKWDRRYGWKPSSARFYQHETNKYIGALLDFIMLSQHLSSVTQAKWRIWHPYDDSQISKNPELKKALLTASDHFPVTVDLIID